MVHIENLIVKHLPQGGNGKLKLGSQDRQVPIQLGYEGQQIVTLVGQGADDRSNAVWAKRMTSPQFGHHKVVQFAACGVNLRAIPSTFIGPTKDDGVYLSDTRDSYDAARLLLPELIQQFHILGDPVAMMPTRGSLLVLGSEDVKRLVGIVKGADRALGSPLYISGIALHYNGEEWVPWLPPPSHPAHIGFRGLQIRTWQHEYSEQEDLLDTLYAKDGESVDLAPYTGVQHPDGRPFSCTIWGPDDNSSLLPKTDLVLFGQGSEEMPRASEWDRVVQQAGELVEALERLPASVSRLRFSIGKAVGGDGKCL